MFSESPLTAQAVLTADILPPGIHRDLYLLWREKWSPDRLPGRGDLDPLAMPKLLPHIALVDVEREPWRFRARVFGTTIVEAIGFDPTGKYLDEVEGTDLIQQRTEMLAHLAQPYYVADEPLRWRAHHFTSYTALGLPLADDGRIVDKLLYSMMFE